MNESNKSEKINRSKLKKMLNQDLKELKSLKKKLIIQEHEQANQLNSFQQIIRGLEQEKEKIDEQYNTDVKLASTEIELSNKTNLKVNPEFVEHAKSKVQGLEIEHNQKIDIIQKNIDNAKGDVSHYQSFMEKKDEGTHKIRHDIDEVTKKTFTEFKTYMLSSSPFEEMVEKLNALLNDLYKRPVEEIADTKSDILSACIEKLETANSFSEWQEAIDLMKNGLNNPKLSITRHTGTFFDCVNRSFEKSTKTVMQDFLGYNESKYDDLWYRAGTQTGPKNW